MVVFFFWAVFFFITDVVDEALDLSLHAPVLELDAAQLVRAHDGLAVGQRQFVALQKYGDTHKKKKRIISNFGDRVANRSLIRQCVVSQHGQTKERKPNKTKQNKEESRGRARLPKATVGRDWRHRSRRGRRRCSVVS